MKVYCHVHKRFPLDHTHSQINPVQTLLPYFFKINYIICSHLCPGLVSDLFPSSIPVRILYVFLMFPHLSYIPDHVIVHNFITNKKYSGGIPHHLRFGWEAVDLSTKLRKILNGGYLTLQSLALIIEIEYLMREIKEH
jgi:hypothetical protein